MIALIDWRSRTWSFDLAVGAYPAVLDRLRGTPARADALVAGVPDSVLSARVGGRWCVKEHLGHLDDLHELDARRLREFLSRTAVLSAADPENRQTHAAHHETVAVQEILARFRRHREVLVRDLEAVTEDDVTTTAIHPRLLRSLRLIDWAQFIADHDDHHLASAREMRHAARGGDA